MSSLGVATEGVEVVMDPGDPELERVGNPTVLKLRRKMSKQLSMQTINVLREINSKAEEENWLVERQQFELKSKEPFAKGAGGAVFLVRWRGLECVAKTTEGLDFTAQSTKDMANEMRLLSSLRHPHLVMFLGACFEDLSAPWLLMEYVGGGTLEARCMQAEQRRIKLPYAERYRYSRQLAQAMTFLHTCTRKIIHRDLKPANVMLTVHGNLKVADFGLGKFSPENPKRDDYKMTGETGSYRFMAPEVFRHEKYDEKVDQYSFALILFYIHAGVRPFVLQADPLEAVKLAATENRRPFAKRVSERFFRQLIVQTWDPSPDHRPPFVDVLDDMEDRSVPRKLSTYATFKEKLAWTFSSKSKGSEFSHVLAAWKEKEKRKTGGFNTAGNMV